MDKLIKMKNNIEKYIYLKEDMPKTLRTLFSITEYSAYSISSIIILYSVIITIIDIYKFIQSNQSKIILLYKLRQITGQLLNISLTLILGGLIIRLLHITNLKTIFLIIITIFLKELIISNIDKESSLVSQKIDQYYK